MTKIAKFDTKITDFLFLITTRTDDILKNLEKKKTKKNGEFIVWRRSAVGKGMKFEHFNGKRTKFVSQPKTDKICISTDKWRNLHPNNGA
jgi:hypothetical protein